MKKGIYQLFFKRCFDIVLSLIAIIILAPVFFIVYLISALILRGNPIFKQYRPGKNGKIFMLYKFRSMTNKKDSSGNLLPDKDRITTWGKILRKTSLDELPQLFNILKGNMSIIGPRPRLVSDMVFYEKEVLKAYTAKPGITGPAQVYDRNSENSWESVFERDLKYAKNITLLNDTKLFFKTFLALFKGGSPKGASHTESSKREYYYPDHLLKNNKITLKQYNAGLQIADELIKNKKSVTFTQELHKKD